MSRLAVVHQDQKEREINSLINNYVLAYNKKENNTVASLRLQLIRIDERFKILPSDTSFEVIGRTGFGELTSDKVKMLIVGYDVGGYLKHLSKQRYEEDRRKEHENDMAMIRQNLADAYADGYKDGLQQGRREMSRRITELQGVIEALGGRETSQTRRLIL